MLIKKRLCNKGMKVNLYKLYFLSFYYFTFQLKTNEESWNFFSPLFHSLLRFLIFLFFHLPTQSTKGTLEDEVGFVCYPN